MKPIEDCVVGIVGLGLMGGAVALALRPLKPVSILALDTDRVTLEAAKAEGIIDYGVLAGTSRGGEKDEEAAALLGRCDLVFLCINPSTLIRFINTRMDAFRSGALITDIAGIKGNIVTAVEKNLRPDLDFIPGHPMAGSEKGGLARAKYCSFLNRNYILTPLKRNRPENLDFLRGLIHRMGFGRITETTAEEHDRKIAFTSQLCHVIAAALIDCDADREITRFGGGSFEDLTRIAMLNVPMWTELFLENKTELLRRIEQFESSLDVLKSLIAGGQEEALEQRLAAVRDRRSAMNG
jgi:prephenate dehydrogenase